MILDRQVGMSSRIGVLRRKAKSNTSTERGLKEQVLRSLEYRAACEESFSIQHSKSKKIRYFIARQTT
jgi:hypothetical protein